MGLMKRNDDPISIGLTICLISIEKFSGQNVRKRFWFSSYGINFEIQYTQNGLPFGKRISLGTIILTSFSKTCLASWQPILFKNSYLINLLQNTIIAKKFPLLLWVFIWGFQIPEVTYKELFIILKNSLFRMPSNPIFEASSTIL